ncbi:MAG TPA: pilus assembly protein N-terminal domain-containing protein [Steroidobacteraceae bacterium]|nr:pilus assembly protein N-terminal domain-containing protein [Steroidobacteraceae bacterium]
MRLALALLVCVGLLGPGGLLAAESVPEQLEMFVGDSRVLGVSVRRVAVANGKVLSVTTVSTDSVLLMGEGAGTTIVQLWLRDGTQQRLTVRVVPADLEHTLTSVNELIAGVPALRARIAGQRVVIDAAAADEPSAARAETVAGLYPGTVLNLVVTAGVARMIHFDVRIVEFRQSRLRELGIRWNTDIAGPTASLTADVASNAALRTRPVRAFFGIATALESRIRLLEEDGDATVVAEPTLSCRSGGSARFVSGGEVPIPVIDKLGGADVEFKEYGVILDVRPVVDASGGIVARVDTEVSQVDDAQRVLGVPGFLKRRSATDVTLRDGETLVIAGLVNRQRSDNTTGIPGLRRAPAVGRAFRSSARRHEVSELVIFLTPHLLTPEAAPADSAAVAAAALADKLQRARDRMRAP